MNLVEYGQNKSIEFVGRNIGIDGICGPDTMKNVIMCFQLACNKDYGSGLQVDGVWGPLSEAAFSGHYVERGECQYLVTAVQIALYAHGYDPNGVEYPGSFGSGCEAAVKKFQSDHGLAADGIAGPATCYALMETSSSGGGSSAGAEGDGGWRKYDPNNLPNFDPDEFKCSCGCGGDVHPDLKRKAQELRDKIGMAMTITSGYRCAYQNRIDGGVSNSLHMQGLAFDMQIFKNGTYHMTDEDQRYYRQLAHECGLTTGNYYGDGGGWMHCQIGSSDYDEWY